ncbi:MAG: tail-specific protease, partial [Flavobacteriaceae bacterium]|nr:tail-specific protease [Flavobacteriaceae bacterium]
MRIDFKKPFFIISCLLFLAISACSFTTNSNDDNPGKDALLIDLLDHVVKNMHFDYKAMDDDFSAFVFDSYLEALDPFKRYFLESDVEEFNQYRLLLDDQFEAKDLSFFNLTYERLSQRIKESQEINDLVLAKAFDFNLTEFIDTDYENLPYANNRTELISRWRKQLKFSALSTYHDKVELQRQKADSLPDFKARPLSELEKEARESVA